MEEMCRVRYGEGGRASMTSPRKHFSKSPGVHQPEASTHLCHLPPAQTCSSPWAKPSDTPLPPPPSCPAETCTSSPPPASLLLASRLHKHVPENHSSTLKTSFLCHTHPLTTGHAAFSTHREASRETCAAGGFHRASKVLFLPVFLSLWSPHPPRWVVFRSSGEFHKGCPIHVPILLLDPPLCLDHTPKLKINITGYLSETDI